MYIEVDRESIEKYLENNQEGIKFQDNEIDKIIHDFLNSHKTRAALNDAVQDMIYEKSLYTSMLTISNREGIVLLEIPDKKETVSELNCKNLYDEKALNYLQDGMYDCHSEITQDGSYYDSEEFTIIVKNHKLSSAF